MYVFLCIYVFFYIYIYVFIHGEQGSVLLLGTRNQGGGSHTRSTGVREDAKGKLRPSQNINIGVSQKISVPNCVRAQLAVGQSRGQLVLHGLSELLFCWGIYFAGNRINSWVFERK